MGLPALSGSFSFSLAVSSLLALNMVCFYRFLCFVSVALFLSLVSARSGGAILDATRCYAQAPVGLCTPRQALPPAWHVLPFLLSLPRCAWSASTCPSA